MANWEPQDTPRPIRREVEMFDTNSLIGVFGLLGLIVAATIIAIAISNVL